MNRRDFLLSTAGGLLAPSTLFAQQPVKPAPEANSWLERNLEAVRSHYRLPALAAACVIDGHIAAEAACGHRKEGDAADVKITDAFQIGSITKPVTATLAGIFVDRGLLRWDLTMEQAFPELRTRMQPAYRKVTVTQLLAHVSGMPYTPRTEGPDFFGKTAKSAQECRFNYVQAALKDRPETPPGTKVIYGGGSILVAALLERLTGKTWERLIEEHLFSPLGMRASNCGEDVKRLPETVDRPWEHEIKEGRGVPVRPVGLRPPDYNLIHNRVHAPAGGINCSAADLARFLIAHIPGTSPRLLSAASLEYLHTPVVGDNCPGWFSGSAPWSGGFHLTHNGSNGLNYASSAVSPAHKSAYGVLTNVAGPVAEKAVAEVCQLAQRTLQTKRFRDIAVFRSFGQRTPTEEITVEFWQHVQAAQMQCAVDMNFSFDQSQNWIVVHSPWNDGQIYWNFGDWKQGGRLQYRPPVAMVGDWHHFAFVASKRLNGMAIYRNGVLEATKEGASQVVPGDYDLFVGFGALPFHGQISEFRIWDRVRTQTEIQQNLNRHIRTDEPGLLAHYAGDRRS